MRWRALYDDGLPFELGTTGATPLSLFAASVERAPDADLIRYFGTSLSFGRCNALSDALAAGLAAQGIGHGDRVALFLQNDPQFVLALLATWKLGGIAVMCSPMLRKRELTEELLDSGATALISLGSLYRDVAALAIPGTAVRVVVTTSEMAFRDDRAPTGKGTYDLVNLISRHERTSFATRSPAPNETAVLTYTSGTTGPAKGAMNTHANIAFASQAYAEWFHMSSDDVILGIAPLFHVTGLVAHIGLALCSGAPLVLAHRFDAAETCRLIELHRATTTVAAITAYIAILDSPASKQYDLSSLEKAYTGGAPISQATLERFERDTGIVIRSVYGLTETTSPTHLTPLRRRMPVDPASGAVSAGLPIFNTSSRIVDDAGVELPRGEVGEIVVSGPQVVPGYWKRPDETAHALHDGELWTGDVGLMDADGWLYVTDRRKDLINAAGFKVWPREVEDVLYEHALVREAAVVGVADPYRGETVCAFVSLVRDASVEPEELVAFCRDRLAAYKYPRRIEILPDLPKTPSGKILRRRLRERIAP